MTNNSYDRIENRIHKYIDEKQKYEVEIEKNNDIIEETDAYIEKMLNIEEADFKVFSPRNAESIYKVEIESKKSEQTDLKKRNEICYKRINEIDNEIEDLTEIAKELHQAKNTYFSILEIQEKERKRIADELHDTSLQNLTHLLHTIELSSMFIDQDPNRAKLELATTNENLKKIIDDIRNTIFNFRPMSFDDLGFVEAISNLCDNYKKEKNIKIDLKMENPEINNSLVLVTLYRIINEAINNAIEHAECSKIILEGTIQNNEYLIAIQDNGTGFDLNTTLNETEENVHFGLSIMKERVSLLGGNLVINSEKENGTKILITVSRNLKQYDNNMNGVK